MFTASRRTHEEPFDSLHGELTANHRYVLDKIMHHSEEI